MTLTYQQQYVLDGLQARAEILNLTARHNRLYAAGDLAGWIATFRHSGATYRRDGQEFSDLRAAFDGGDARRLVTADNEIVVDGVHATQRCVALLFVDGQPRSTGVFDDRLIYERGGWYFTSRELTWDPVPVALPSEG
ncbi:nuclear transport factor 2 family protein [Mycolicibacterium flavescens]|uniref:SnoaL-like domain-containing protein n=1 Tax=Mycolicibacterium flavescens TaxID=1776 RepID=A0A1E3RLS2_MYCFV|nr:nuclear transport factor 2 family protein [Mycolicibacterium flavescens]MCV7281777.1 nuclear transport factor 2 family protein [Mycolicibacterium flavescens]ODQ90833.1 hypothetical protein BHQ18_08930 [Mycolicibacterium flavescens]